MLVRLVSADERAHANRFRYAGDRDRYLVGRARLRLLLAKYLRSDPSAIPITAAKYGKPYVDDPGAEWLQFNVAHSGDVIVYALCRGRAVGVDVEPVHTDLDIERMARRLFTVAEQRRLAELPEARRPRLFITLWTRKEAVLKAVGAGLTIEPNRIEALPGRPVKLRTTDPPGNWSIAGFASQPGYRAAVAVTPPCPNLPRRAERFED